MPPSTTNNRRHRPSPISSAEPRRRRSSRGSSSLTELAKEIVFYRKNIVFITGAGISVASGVRPFRGSSGVWTQHIWTTATRESFRKDPLTWYNDFWLPCLSLPKSAKPNAAHHALSELLNSYGNCNMITQNVDGLHTPSSQVVEAHGRLGLFKCMPTEEEDSDTDSEDDDDDERLVHLGHRRKRRLARKKTSRKAVESGDSTDSNSDRSSCKDVCLYQQVESLSVDEVEPASIRDVLQSGRGRLTEAPKCPACHNPLAPQALLFDEGYHSHDFYQFRTMEDWMAQAEVIVFVGTSFAVRLPEIALEHARAVGLPVYNFNTQDMLDSTVRLNATNCKGPSEVMLPKLLEEVRHLERQLGIEPSQSTREGNAAMRRGVAVKS